MLVNNKINLICFPELKPTKFSILLKYNELIKEVKLKMAWQLPKCIFDSLNKNFNILINKLPKAFPLYKKLNHKIEVVLGLVSSSKAGHIS